MPDDLLITWNMKTSVINQLLTSADAQRAFSSAQLNNWFIHSLAEKAKKTWPPFPITEKRTRYQKQRSIRLKLLDSFFKKNL